MQRDFSSCIIWQICCREKREERKEPLQIFSLLNPNASEHMVFASLFLPSPFSLSVSIVLQTNTEGRLAGPLAFCVKHSLWMLLGPLQGQHRPLQLTSLTWQKSLISTILLIRFETPKRGKKWERQVGQIIYSSSLGRCPFCQGPSFVFLLPP